MPASDLTRRNLIAATAATAAAATSAIAFGDVSEAALTMGGGTVFRVSEQALATVAMLREQRERWYVASSKAANLECREDSPGFRDYKAAEGHAQSLWDEGEALTAQLAELPVRSWDDVVVRAEIARLSNAALEFDFYSGRRSQEQHLIDLVAAIFTLAGCMPPKPQEPDRDLPAGMVEPNPLTAAEWETMTLDSWFGYDISFVGQFVTEHFGTDEGFNKAALYFDVPAAAVLGWNREEYIPFRWHHAVYPLLRDSGATMAPYLLGLTEAEAAGMAAHRRNRIVAGGAHA